LTDEKLVEEGCFVAGATGVKTASLGESGLFNWAAISASFIPANRFVMGAALAQ